MTSREAEASPVAAEAAIAQPTPGESRPPSRLSIAAPPTLRAEIPGDEVLDRLDRLARRGRLPGYKPTPDGGFKVALFSEPFDRELVGTILPSEAGAEIRFRTRMKRRMPTALAVTVAVSVWPGVHLVDSLIPASWGWWPTWTWYLPLMILPIPAALPGLMKKSRRRADDHLAEQIERIAQAIGAA